MTTIVFDGYTLAADMRSTRTSSKHECLHCGESTADTIEGIDKIIVPKHPVYYKDELVLAMAISGNATFNSFMSELVKYIEKVETIFETIFKITLGSGAEFSILIVTDKFCYAGICNVKKTSLKKYDITDDLFVTIGSGKLLAKAGKEEFFLKAKECVEFASKYDPGTSKDTTTFVVREYPKEKTTSELVKVAEKAVSDAINGGKDTLKINMNRKVDTKQKGAIKTKPIHLKRNRAGEVTSTLQGNVKTIYKRSAGTVTVKKTKVKKK